MRISIFVGCLLALPLAAFAEKGAPFEPDCAKLLTVKEIETTCGIKLKKNAIQINAANSPTPAGRCSIQYQQQKTNSLVDVTIDWAIWKGVDGRALIEGHRTFPDTHDFTAVDGLGSGAVRYVTDASGVAVSFPTVEIVEDRWLVKLVSSEEPRRPAACSLDELVELARTIDSRLKK